MGFDLPDQQSFEYYLFSSSRWQTRHDPSMVAWSTLNRGGKLQIDGKVAAIQRALLLSACQRRTQEFMAALGR